MELSVTEFLATHGLMALDAELAKKKSAFAAELEKAHGLDPGSLGNTHHVNAATGMIVAEKDVAGTGPEKTGKNDVAKSY